MCTISFFTLFTIFLCCCPEAFAGQFEANNRGIKNAEYAKKIDNLFEAELSNQPIFDPQTEFLAIDGSPVTLKEYRDKFIILYFYGMWCTNCSEELRALKKFSEYLKFKDINDVVILPIAEDVKSGEKLFNFYQDQKLEGLPMLVDDKKKAMSALGVRSLPTTFFVNKKGFFIFKVDKPQAWSNEYLMEKIIAIKDGLDIQVEDRQKNEYSNSNSSDIISNKGSDNKTTILN